MTKFRETDQAQDFINSADSRSTSKSIMQSIADFAIDANDAESMWEDLGNGVFADYLDIFQRASEISGESIDQLIWGDSTLAEIQADLGAQQ